MRKKNRHIPEELWRLLHAGSRTQPQATTPPPAKAWRAATDAPVRTSTLRAASLNPQTTHTNYNYLYILPHWYIAGFHDPLAVCHGQTAPRRPAR